MPTTTGVNIGISAFTTFAWPKSPDDIELYIKHLRTLNPQKIICATKAEDPLVRSLKNLCDELIEIPDAEFGYRSIHENLYKYSGENPLLTVSIGVEIRQPDLVNGLEIINQHKFYNLGWEIKSQGNDGSVIGKLGYHTCMLFPNNYYEIYQSLGGFPKYVENNVLGYVNASSKHKIPIGGQEELAMQLKLFKKFGTLEAKLFGLITSSPLEFPLQIGNGVSFQDKIERKISVAKAYCEIENVSQDAFIKSWKLF